MRTQKEWSASPLPAVTLPEVIGTELAGALRSRLAARGYERYRLVDRGSYDHVDEPHAAEPELAAVLVALASEITGRSLSLVSSRALRLGPGDYVLVRHDRVAEDRPVELVLDVSRAPVEGAEIHYRHRGQVFFAVPSAPGLLSLVERGPTVLANHTYVSKLQADAEVVRLVMLLQG
ncbi:MAG: hypothetical protein JWP97_1293 [Labilithrix sp.]|nr:hypothetical protein [Labilithrix sp.]